MAYLAYLGKSLHLFVSKPASPCKILIVKRSLFNRNGLGKKFGGPGVSIQKKILIVERPLFNRNGLGKNLRGFAPQIFSSEKKSMAPASVLKKNPYRRTILI